MTSLAATNADVFVLGATLLACPTSLTQVARRSWKPITYMSGTCTSKTLMTIAGAAGDGVLSVAPLMDPNDPQYAERRSDDALQGEDRAVRAGRHRRRQRHRRVRLDGAAALEALLATVEEPNRLGVMQAARSSRLSDVGLQLPDSTWSVDADDWFLGENFDLVQYSLADGFFKPVGERHRPARRDRGDHAREPDQRLARSSTASLARASGSVTTSRPSSRPEPVAVAAVQFVVGVEPVEVAR